MPTPGGMHRKLERLLGTWYGQERLYPSPFDPQGGAAIGRIHNYRAIDGFAVVQEYEQERGGTVTFRAHGVFRWEPLHQAYELYWFDSMGMAPAVFRGNFDEDVLTLTAQHGQGFTRARWDLAGAPAHYTFVMEVSGDGVQWQPFSEGRYAQIG
jgi:hypothetical protein